MSAVRLELLAASHLDDLEVLVQDPEVQRFTRIPSPAPPGFSRQWLDTYEAGRATGTMEAFAIVDDDGSFLGVAVSPWIDGEGLTAELGMAIASTARGRGVATEALRQLIAWGFSELGFMRLEALISIENDASKRLVEKCGFVREGVLRSLHVKQGVREDTELWSRLAGDPQPY
jgi:RimJ/RimL family protein N-acetyltransferase